MVTVVHVIHFTVLYYCNLVIAVKKLKQHTAQHEVPLQKENRFYFHCKLLCRILYSSTNSVTNRSRN